MGWLVWQAWKGLVGFVDLVTVVRFIRVVRVVGEEEVLELMGVVLKFFWVRVGWLDGMGGAGIGREVKCQSNNSLIIP